MVNTTIVMGIDERRVREVCSEVAVETIKQCTQEASAAATSRIEKFTTELIPRVEKIEKDFQSFSDPSFQFELRNAQKVAACTDNDGDYELLSELLVHRIEKGTERKTKASISKAIEIVDQVDEDALCALTIIYAINSWIVTSGNITQGLTLMNNLFASLGYRTLPEGLEWAYHLDILNAARVSAFSTFKKFREYYSEQFQGYICVGIQKDSDVHHTAIEILKEANLPTDILVEHELNSGYVRINVYCKNAIKDINILVHEQLDFVERKVTDLEIEAINKVWDLYSNDVSTQEMVKNTFMQKWDSFEALKNIRLWWESLPHSVTITPIGKVLAHANAQRYNSMVPEIKF